MRVREDQSNTSLIILQASDGAGAQCFLPMFLFICLFVCEFGSTRNVHALMDVQVNSEVCTIFSHTIANLNFKITKD